jgi:sulfite exporter TauE/SafE
MTILFTAIALGFLGSFHCIGMCGPIALALPVNQMDPFKKTLSILSYSAGRTSTYMLLGILTGLLGESISFFGWQRLFTVVIGSLILFSVLLPSQWTGQFKILQPLHLIYNSLKNKMSRLFSKRTIISFFTIGQLNGILPCGFVYIALLSAFASGDITKSAIFMAGFGLGTLPMMVSISWVSTIIGLRFRTGVRSVSPYLISVMAILMILRGLNLGIPYVSPKMTVEPKTSQHLSAGKLINCH